MKKAISCMLAIFMITVFQYCTSPNSGNSNVDDQYINKNAPFYTHQVKAESPRISKDFDTTKIESFWPFIIYKDSSYMVVAALNTDTTLDKFGSFLERYRGEGTGYNWAALIKVILKKEKPDLLKHLDFDPEGGAFYLFADSEKSQRQFAEFISKAFNDTTKLINYLTGPDKEQTLNYNPKD